VPSGVPQFALFDRKGAVLIVETGFSAMIALPAAESQRLSGNEWRVFPGGRGSRRAATWRFGHHCADSLSCGGRSPRSGWADRDRLLRVRLSGSFALPFDAAIQGPSFRAGW